MLSSNSFFDEESEVSDLIVTEERPDLADKEPILKKIFKSNSDKFGNFQEQFFELHHKTLLIYDVSTKNAQF